MGSKDTFTAEVPKEIVEDPAYTEWFEDLDGSPSVRIEAARETIESEGVITSAKDLGDGLYEKKWNNGLRLYFAVIEDKKRETLLLLGSGKGKEQDKAIKESKKNLKKYKVVTGSIVKKD
jgi:hypothetical protein